MNIIPIIRDLLLRNQKAVIPGFGSFFVVRRPARLNKTTNVLSPPVIVIRFDEKQQDDDGQLAGYLVQKLKQNPSEVKKAIEAFSKEAVEQLKVNKHVVLEGLGTLSKEKSGDIHFSSEEELVRRLAVFELPKLNLSVPQNEPKPPVIESKKEIPVFVARKKSKWWITAVILLSILMGLLAAVYFTGNLDELVSDITKAVTGKEITDSSEKLIFGKKINNDATPADSLQQKISREIDERTSRENALAYKETRPARVETNTSSDLPNPVPVKTDKPYHIIAGSFQVIENAEKQKVQLEKKGVLASILPKHGEFYMVSLGSFDTKEEANAASAQMEEDLQKELWVMKR